MKNRKIFLDGYVELSRSYFKSGRTYESYVVLNAINNFIGVSEGALQLAKVNAHTGEYVNARFGIHSSNDKFAIMFDDGDFEAKRYGKSMLRFCATSVVRELIKCGFHAGKRYKVTSPEEGVLVVTKEEA